jgi:hypothetical protein
MSATINLGFPSSTPVTTLNANNTYTISYQVDQTLYPHANYFLQWFTLGYATVANGDVNICGGGTAGPGTYVYNAGNSSYDDATNTMYLTFYLPDIGTTISEVQYGVPFTLTVGDLYIRAYTLYPGVSEVTEMLAQQITLGPSLVCFKKDSKILTNKGYVPVQDLRKGDLVKTLKHDFVPVNMIGFKEIHNVACENRIKDQLYKCSKDKYPELLEDLVITGCHSILVDKFASEEQRNRVIEINGDTYVTNNKYRLPAAADDRASVYEVAGKHTIYHFALDNSDYYANYGVYANGLLVETCSKRYLKELSRMELI